MTHRPVIAVVGVHVLDSHVLRVESIPEGELARVYRPTR